MIHLVCYLGWHISKSPWRNLVLVCSSLGSTRYASVFLAIYHFHSFLNLISFFWPLTQCPIFCFIFFQRDSSSFFLTLVLNMQHMEVPRLGVEVELQLLAYITAIATWDPNHICDLYHSSRQRWILNPLSEARDQTCNLMVTSQIRFCWAIRGTPEVITVNSLLHIISYFFWSYMGVYMTKYIWHIICLYRYICWSICKIPMIKQNNFIPNSLGMFL